MTSLSENRKGGSNQFSAKSFDGRRGKVVCSKCLEDKATDQVVQVRDGRTKKYVCKNCSGDENQ